jgi:DNA replication protein DnaC
MLDCLSMPERTLPETADFDEAAPPRDLNPHLARRSGPNYPCPYGLCGGEGFVLDEETDAAKPCRCRQQRIAHARHRRLRNEIPERYRGVAWDRNPVPALLEALGPTQAAALRRFARKIDEKLDAGEGLWFMGPRGTGKTTLAMLLSIEALRARRAVGIYTAPQLLDDIYASYRSQDERRDVLMQRLLTVDLLHLEDLAAVAPNDHVRQVFYSVVNERYQEKRSIIFTADVTQPPQLADYVGDRVYSRLMEMCGDPIPLFDRDHRIPAYGDG